MYSNAKEEKDNKIAESLQRDGDGVLIFVSPRVGIQISLCLKQEYYRPVYSLPQSLRSLP
jgi:reverse gyrase